MRREEFMIARRMQARILNESAQKIPQLSGVSGV